MVQSGLQETFVICAVGCKIGLMHCIIKITPWLSLKMNLPRLLGIRKSWPCFPGTESRDESFPKIDMQSKWWRVCNFQVSNWFISKFDIHHPVGIAVPHRTTGNMARLIETPRYCVMSMYGQIQWYILLLLTYNQLYIGFSSTCLKFWVEIWQIFNLTFLCDLTLHGENQGCLFAYFDVVSSLQKSNQTWAFFS